jgi:hypothetical protein
VLSPWSLFEIGHCGGINKKCIFKMLLIMKFLFEFGALHFHWLLSYRSRLRDLSPKRLWHFGFNFVLIWQFLNKSLHLFLLLFSIFFTFIILHYIPKEYIVLFTAYIFPDNQKYLLHFECLEGQENSQIHGLIKRTGGHPYCVWHGGLTKQTCIFCK